MKDNEIAAAVAQEFPKHNKTAFSLASRPGETGVTFTPRALEIVWNVAPEEAVQKGLVRPQERKKQKRKKSVRFSARLTPSTAQAVKQKMARLGIESKQTLIETLLLDWIKNDAPTAVTVETPE